MSNSLKWLDFLLGRTSRSGQDGRLWTRDFVLNLLAMHFLFVGFSATWTTIPPFAIKLGSDPALQLTIIVGAFGIIGLFIRPFGGQWVYILGPKRVAVVGTIIFALGSLSYFALDIVSHIYSTSAWWLVPMRMVQGVGLALGPLGTWTIAANIAPPERRAEAMSYTGNAIAVASLYAPFMASFIYEGAGAREAFFFSALATAAATIACLLISSRRVGFQQLQPSAREREESGRPPLVARSAIFPTLILLTYTFTTASTSAYLPMLADEGNLGNPGLFFTVFSLMSMLAMAASGHVADRFGRATVIVPGLLLVALGMFVVSLATTQTVIAPGMLSVTLWMLVVSISTTRAIFLSGGILAGLGSGMLQPGVQSLTVDRAPLRERSAALATLQQAWDIGGFLLVPALGPVQRYAGTASTFGFTGIGALIGMLGFIIVNAKSPTKLPGGTLRGNRLG